MAYSTIPTNRSFLSNNKFDFVLNRIPNFTFLVQSVNLPGISLGLTEVPTSATTLRIPGTIVNFSSVSLSFIVDEGMQSWYEIYNWITRLGNPTSSAKQLGFSQEPGGDNYITSDASLLIKTNANNPSWRVDFFEMFPTDLSDINFSTTESQEFITSSATFNYTYYTVTNLTN